MLEVVTGVSGLTFGMGAVNEHSAVAPHRKAATLHARSAID